MKAYDYDAVTYDGAVYCVECLPNGITVDHDEEVSPIFADSEWDTAPVCDSCGAEHDYMTILADDTAEPTEPEEGDITTEDHERFYQSGRLVLHKSGDVWYVQHGSASNRPMWTEALGTFGDDHKAAVRAYMEHAQYWPNVWWISDHGNAHLMSVAEE